VADVRPATIGDVRALLGRVDADEATLHLAGAAVESATAWAVRDEGEAIALCIAHDSDDERAVGWIFVEESFRGEGTGAALLDAAFSGIEDRSRSMVFPADDPACAALALRRGLALAAPLLEIAGALPREEALMAMAAGSYTFEVSPLDGRGNAPELDSLDRQTRGTTRGIDHVRFGTRATGLGFWLAGEMVAYAYAWPDGRIGPIAASSAAYLVQLVAFVLVTLQRTHGASWCTALIPSANVRVARALLRAGLTIGRRYGFASDATAIDLSRYVAYRPIVP